MRVLGVAVALVAVAAAAYGALRSAATPPRPAPDRARAGASRSEVDAAVARGVAYLVGAQNRDGSWGGPASNLWDIYAPVPGSYYAFQVGASALAAAALHDVEALDPRAGPAARRGVDFLVENPDLARRVSPDVLYNVWAHAYAIEALARAHDRARAEGDAARAGRVLATVARAVDYLERFEFVDGGWGYYNFDVVARRPEHGATSFTTATALLALAEARRVGARVPDRLVRRALDLVQTCRKPDGSFAYSWDHRFFPWGGINKTKGSLARSPACLGALERWDDGAGPDDLVRTLDELERYGHFLQIARKYPRPHESWYQNSGYFCFYGYDAASRLLERVPAADARRHAAAVAASLVPLQEPDGSFWDYQLYSYHKAYGTGFVLSALARCRPHLR